MKTFAWRNRGSWHFLLTDGFNHSGVELNGTSNCTAAKVSFALDTASATACTSGRTGGSGGVTQQCHLWINSELLGSVRGHCGDFRELIWRGVRIHGAIARLHSTPSITSKKMEETTLEPGAVLMIWKEGLMVCAVVCAAPETMPSASPLCTIIVA